MVEIHLGIRREDNKVIVDGKDITDYLTKIKVEKTPSTIPVVELELKPNKVKVTGDVYFIRDKGLKEYDNEELTNELIRRKQIIVNDILVKEGNIDIDKIAEKLVQKLNNAILDI